MKTFFLPLLVLLACAACHQADASVSETSGGAATPAAAEATPGAEGAANGEVAQADEVSAERYPALLFELLDATERARYVGLAEAELCPCEGGVQSMDACLQTETVCELAVQAGAVLMRMVKEGAPDLQISDELQQFVTNARRVWEFDLDGVPYVGAEDPVITLVNFSDFECPHCRVYAEALHTMLETHGDQVRVYFKQFPLGGHRNAAAAAVAALAAHQQGQFGTYHDLVFEHQAALSAAEDPTALLVALANQVGLNLERFAEDANSQAMRDQVDADRAEGIASGIQSTPTCYMNGVRMMDGYSTEELNARIEAALAAAAPAEAPAAP